MPLPEETTPVYTVKQFEDGCANARLDQDRFWTTRWRLGSIYAGPAPTIPDEATNALKAEVKEAWRQGAKATRDGASDLEIDVLFNEFFAQRSRP